MRKRLSLYLFFVFCIAVVGYTACIKDHCGDVVCKNGGVCVNGACACPLGYEGDNCEKKWNEKYVGTWHATDSIYKDNIARFKYDIAITNGITKDSFFVIGLTDTLIDSVVVCVRTSAYGFSMIADKKLDSTLTVKSGVGVIDSITGHVSGKYVYRRKTPSIDTTVTVGFSWKK